ncbi:unnamed protein product [Victoria cruziana]
MSTVNGYGLRLSGTQGKVITCKAAVLWGPNEPFVIEEIQVEPPQPLEVRIKVLYTSICHTDLSFWKGENEAQQKFPRILGHEAAGIVESVGEGVADLKPGDHVVPIFNGECGDCAYCRSEKTNLCGKYRVDPFRSTMLNDGRTRFSVRGQPVYHFLSTSTFSEYTVLDYACVVKVDRKAPLEKMCLLSCGVSTGVGAVWNAAKMEAGATVAVFGLGGVGLAVAEGARVSGASRIIGVDINPDKFPKAKRMGVTDFVNPKDYDRPVHQVIGELIEGGVDYSFECTGNYEVLREAFVSTHDGWGRTIIVGIHASPKMLPLHPMELFNGREIIGSTFGGFKGRTQLPGLAHRCMKGEVNLEGFITHELRLQEINDAFKLLIEGRSLRCLLHL